jgi:hypothetical protein
VLSSAAARATLAGIIERLLGLFIDSSKMADNDVAG